MLVDIFSWMVAMVTKTAVYHSDYGISRGTVPGYVGAKLVLTLHTFYSLYVTCNNVTEPSAVPR